MTERKPAGVSWESWIDRQIREAQERGEFENLPGAGKPIASLNEPHDELWWVKQFLQRENISVTPGTLAVRHDLERALDEIRAASSESRVREIAEAINVKIRESNAKPTSGPPSRLMPLDIEAVLASWRDRQRAANS